MKKLVLSFILRDIKHYFGFLFERGYKIRDAEYVPEKLGNWGVDLESSTCNIQMYSDRTVLFLVFIPLNRDRKNGISIEAMIYFLTEGREFIGDLKGHYTSWSKKDQYERLASLVKAYIDQIEPYFGNEFQTYKDDLLAAQKKYNDRLSLERRRQRMKK